MGILDEKFDLKFMCEVKGKETVRMTLEYEGTDIENVLEQEGKYNDVVAVQLKEQLAQIRALKG
jgi:hypothetical protein